MRLIRTFHGGADIHDPRCKLWAEYKCDCCNKESHIDVTRMTETWDFTRERSCPHCKQTSPIDAVSKLRVELERLTMSKSNIEIQIDEIIRKLNLIETNQ